MNFEEIPANGAEVEVEGQTGYVSRSVSTTSGVELTVRLNDDSNDVPTSVPQPVHTEAWTNAYAPGVPASERLAPTEELVETEMPTQEEKDAEREELDRVGREEDEEVANKRNAKVEEVSNSSEKADGNVHSHLLDTQARKETVNDKGTSPKSTSTAKASPKANQKN
jgi:hypothetical protein